MDPGHLRQGACGARTSPSKLRGEPLVGVTQGVEIPTEFIQNPLLFHGKSVNGLGDAGCSVPFQS